MTTTRNSCGSSWTAAESGYWALATKKTLHRSEAVLLLYAAQLKRGEKSYIDKPRVKVFMHNGTTVYETNNHRAAWEKRYAQYVDSINTNIKARKANGGVV